MSNATENMVNVNATAMMNNALVAIQNINDSSPATHESRAFNFGQALAYIDTLFDTRIISYGEYRDLYAKALAQNAKARTALIALGRLPSEDTIPELVARRGAEG